MGFIAGTLERPAHKSVEVARRQARADGLDSAAEDVTHDAIDLRHFHGRQSGKVHATVVAPIAVQSRHHVHHDLSLIHISEPTRLGMISYAVFCLKTKKNG